MVLVGKLPEPVQIDITKIEQRSIKQRHVNGSPEDDDGIEFSMTSVLNKRPQGVLVNGLSDNKLNLRYTKRKAAPLPPVANGHLIANGFPNGDIHTIHENENNLSKTQLNKRYNLTNGEDMSPTKLNQRYLRVTRGAKHHGVADRIARKSHKDAALERMAGSSDNLSVGTGHSDWSHWVEDVFSNALNEHVDGLSDARSVENRLKGGGKGGGTGVPGPQFQQQVHDIWGFKLISRQQNFSLVQKLQMTF